MRIKSEIEFYVSLISLWSLLYIYFLFRGLIHAFVALKLQNQNRRSSFKAKFFYSRVKLHVLPFFFAYGSIGYCNEGSSISGAFIRRDK